MGMFRMGTVSSLDQKGQSTVEYILLFAVVISMSTLVFNSEAFKNLFGKNGQFASVYKRELEYSYRHGLAGKTSFKTPNYKSGRHDSYNGRFFGAQDAYPKQ